jgi:hypothetical protein
MSNETMRLVIAAIVVVVAIALAVDIWRVRRRRSGSSRGLGRIYDPGFADSVAEWPLDSSAPNASNLEPQGGHFGGAGASSYFDTGGSADCGDSDGGGDCGGDGGGGD